MVNKQLMVEYQCHQIISIQPSRLLLSIFSSEALKVEIHWFASLYSPLQLNVFVKIFCFFCYSVRYLSTKSFYHTTNYISYDNILKHLQWKDNATKLMAAGIFIHSREYLSLSARISTHFQLIVCSSYICPFSITIKCCVLLGSLIKGRLLSDASVGRKKKGINLGKCRGFPYSIEDYTGRQCGSIAFNNTLLNTCVNHY